MIHVVETIIITLCDQNPDSFWIRYQVLLKNKFRIIKIPCSSRLSSWSSLPTRRRIWRGRSRSLLNKRLLPQLKVFPAVREFFKDRFKPEIYRAQQILQHQLPSCVTFKILSLSSNLDNLPRTYETRSLWKRKQCEEWTVFSGPKGRRQSAKFTAQAHWHFLINFDNRFFFLKIRNSHQSFDEVIEQRNSSQKTSAAICMWDLDDFLSLACLKWKKCGNITIVLKFLYESLYCSFKLQDVVFKQPLVISSTFKYIRRTGIIKLILIPESNQVTSYYYA